MTQARDRLPRPVKRAHEFPRLRRLAEQVGIDKAPRKQQPVVIVGVRFGDRFVHVNAAGRLVQVHAADIAVAQRDHVYFSAGRLQCLHRDDQFHLLEAVRRESRDSAAFQSLIH